MCRPDRPHTGVPPHLENWGYMCGSHTATGMLGLSGSEQNPNKEREVRGSRRLMPVLSVSWLVFWFGLVLPFTAYLKVLLICSSALFSFYPRFSTDSMSLCFHRKKTFEINLQLFFLLPFLSPTPRLKRKKKSSK